MMREMSATSAAEPIALMPESSPATPARSSSAPPANPPSIPLCDDDIVRSGEFHDIDPCVAARGDSSEASIEISPERPRPRKHRRPISAQLPAPSPVPADGEEEEEVTCGRATASCALSGFGWCFDVGTALVSVADVVSDFMVAAQFASEGLWVWFGLVIASLFISNCVFTVWFNEAATKMPPFRPLEDITRKIRYPIVFLVAQLLPTVVWAGQVAVRCGFCANQEDDSDDVVDIRFMTSDKSEAVRRHRGWNNADAEAHAAVAVREEMAAAAASSLLLGRLEAALSQHMKAHSMFYIETVIEAIPQSVIQLLAMTFLGRASGVQIVSTVLSLLTISSKAYVVSRSCDVRMFLFKFALAVHDVFCLFYVFSTLLSRDGSLDWDLFGTGVELSTMSCVWIIRLFAVVGIVAIIAAITALIFFIQAVGEDGCDVFPDCEDIPFIFLGIFLFLLVVVPGILFFDAMKFGWLIVFELGNQPNVRNFPALSSALAFLRRGNFNERARHIMGFAVRDRYRKMTAVRPGYFKRVNGNGPNNYVIDNLTNYAKWSRDGKTTPFDFKMRRGQDPSGKWDVSLPDRPSDAEEGFILLAVILVIGTYTIGQVFGAVFPFVNMAVEGWDGQNHIQLVCFVLDAAALLVALILLPSAWDYVKLMALRTAGNGFQSTWAQDEGTMLRCIEEYVVPPHHTVLWAVVPAEVVPALVTVNVVAPFATARDVGLHRLSGQQCRAYADGFDATFAVSKDMVGDEAIEEIITLPRRRKNRRRPRRRDVDDEEPEDDDDATQRTITWVPAPAPLRELDACGPLRPQQSKPQAPPEQPQPEVPGTVRDTSSSDDVDDDDDDDGDDDDDYDDDVADLE